MAHEKSSPSTNVTIPAAPQPASNEGLSLIKDLVEALQRRNPSAQDTMGLSAERQESIHRKTPARRYRSVMLKGENGATAIGRVCEEAGMPHGRIVRTEQYKYPEGMTKHTANGGIVPDGLPIFSTANPSGLTYMSDEASGKPFEFIYVEWKHETFTWKDLREWNGRALKLHYCDPAGKGLETPWEEHDQAAE
jgi:hypothetical protein